MSEENQLVYYISRIRKVVLVTISLFVIYHSVLHIDSRRDSCQWLLQHGRLVANNKWQPFGCLSYNYNLTDSKLCLRRSASSSKTQTHLVFMGDSRILQLYNYIKEHMFAKLSYIPAIHNYSIYDHSLQKDTRYDDDELGLALEFKWRPNPSFDVFSDFGELLHPHSIHKKRLDSMSSIGNDLLYQNKNSANIIIHQKRPSLKAINKLIIVGHSLWPNSWHSSYESMLDVYKTNMTRLLSHLQNLKQSENDTKILWSLQDPIIEKRVKLRINMSNSQIDEFNYITENLIDTVSIKDLTLLTSHRGITKSLSKLMSDDGIHSSELIVEYKAQIILNYICNRIYNYDSTCCSENQNINLTQLLFILVALIMVSAYSIYLIRPYFMNDKKRINTVKWQKVPQYDNTTMLQDEELQDSDHEDRGNILAYDDQVTLFNDDQMMKPKHTGLSLMHEELLINIAKFSLAILFMFICDRTNFFMKENKYFTLANFILPIIYMFALGIFFTEAQPDTSYSRAGFMLSRNQTDEWKGWMQLIVLIYNLSSAENNLRIYMLIRVLLSSYLFLTGYGHFTYFYKTGDTSLRRLFQIIFRLNLSVVCLCLCMNRPYQYYYFVPLVTFWFIIVFLFMKIQPIKNSARPTANDHFWIIFKLSILLGFITVLYASEVFFEKIFILSPWKFLFASGQNESNIKDWWHHWSVDRYSVLAGMIYGLVHWTIVAPYLGISDSNIMPRNVACHSRESSQGSQDELVLSNPLVTFQGSIKPNSSFIITLALSGISFYSLFAATCSDKASCDEIHAYVSFVPIICYIILRNANVFLRNRHSILFAFIGRISLGLSLCQYHIWLAAGQKGILVLVPSNPTLNLVITSIIFITTSQKLNSINRQLTQYATSND